MIPILDNTFFVDNSMIELITTCPWEAYASIIRRKRPAGDFTPLRFGGFLHQVIDYRYTQQGLNLSWTEAEMISQSIKLFTSTPCEYEGWRNLDTAIKVIRAYNAHYTPQRETFTIVCNEQTKLPLVEQPFACDTGKIIRGYRIVYTGRMDRVIREPDGSVFVVDTKTTSMMGDTFWDDQSITEQHRGYCWALRECTGINPTGYIVDAIGARESIATAYFDEITGTVRPESTKSKAVPLELMRQPFYTQVPGGQLDEWFENMLNQVDMFLYLLEKCGDNPVLWETHRHHKQCIRKYGKCQFFNVCSLPRQSREDALQSSAFTANEWSPLYSDTQVKPIETKKFTS